MYSDTLAVFVPNADWFSKISSQWDPSLHLY